MTKDLARLKFKAYLSLTKPGIIRGNLITLTAGFLLASKGHIDFGLFLAVSAGTALVIASGCVFNNYIDLEIDKKMSRTQKRALVTGSISKQNALVYATVLGLAGFIVLAQGTNVITVLTGLSGLFFYVVVYGVFKRRSSLGTIVGSISGALPPVAGYLSVTNHLDAAAFILFLILVCWQMPHFYSIAMYRFKDYTAAGLPVLPVISGIRATKIQILAYITMFTAAALALTAYGFTGYLYAVTAALLGGWWLGLSIRGFRVVDDEAWARKMFHVSLLVITVLCVMISVDLLLP